MSLVYSCNSNHDLDNQSEDSGQHQNENLFEHLAFYESEQRNIWQQPNYVIELFGDNLEDKVIADIGASTGYFTFHSLPKVKKMIAIDIDSTMINYMKKKVYDLPEHLQHKVDIRLTERGKTVLKKDEIDGALLVSTYPYIHDKSKFFKNIDNGLKPDGQLVFIEFKNIDIPNGPPDSERIAYQQLIQDLENNGYQTKLDTTSLTYQYIVIATKQ